MSDLVKRDQEIKQMKDIIKMLRSERKELKEKYPDVSNSDIEELNIAIDNILSYLDDEKMKEHAPIARINAAIKQTRAYKN